jgi:hypothetical protein
MSDAKLTLVPAAGAVVGELAAAGADVSVAAGALVDASVAVAASSVAGTVGSSVAGAVHAANNPKTTIEMANLAFHEFIYVFS